jgi:hypothetical protein
MEIKCFGLHYTQCGLLPTERIKCSSVISLLGFFVLFPVQKNAINMNTKKWERACMLSFFIALITRVCVRSDTGENEMKSVQSHPIFYFPCHAAIL